MSFFRSLFGSSALESDVIKVLSPSEFKAGIKKGKVQVVDVRTPVEFKSGHISKAKNIDFFQRSSFKTKLEKLNKTQPLYLYCHSGSRSKKAAGIAESLGFEEIYDLKGGFINFNK